MSINNQIRQSIKANITLTALGNSNRTMRDVAIDLIHASGLQYKDIANDCYLCTATIKNLALGKTLNPQSETIERIFRNFELQLTMKDIRLQEKFANKAKK